MGAVKVKDAEQASREIWDAATEALNRVSFIFQECLGRFPGATELRVQVPSLKHEPASEPLHISVK